MIPTKIISGGQTGADQAGLRAAKKLGIATGGWMPKGWRTEEGPRPEFKELYGMLEHSMAGYPPRTRTNVLAADGTIVFGQRSRGSEFTVTLCQEHHRGCLRLHDERFDLEIIRDWLTMRNIRTLNIAGNRESVNPGIGVWVEAVLLEALKS